LSEARKSSILLTLATIVGLMKVLEVNTNTGALTSIPAYSRRRGVQFHILAEEQSIGL